VRLPRSLMRKRRSERRAHPVARSQPQFQVFVVSADFKTNRKTRPRDPYRALARLLSGLGGVLAPTHQMRLLVSPYRAVKIRDGIKASILQRGDRVYVGKIARGSAWHNLLRISNAKLKKILTTWAKGVEPTEAEVAAARRAISRLLPS
jgi:hypothetical protein